MGGSFPSLGHPQIYAASGEAVSIPVFGVGLQLNPALLGWFPFREQKIDVLEILFDSIMTPVDGPGLMNAEAGLRLTEAAGRFPLIGHSNYGGDFGFDDLADTSAVQRHVPLAKKFAVPWVSNHCFYSDGSWSDVWSSPLQFSRDEICRVGARARELQSLYGVPLAHENAAYYVACPGSEMPEEEFLAQLVDAAGTFLHLDLHNLYANELNHRAQGYSISRFLDTIPLDRVICIHMAGGRWIGGRYHDLHDTQVPDAVWDLLDEVLSKAKPGAVILEYETANLHRNDAPTDQHETIDLIAQDIDRARNAWARAYGSAEPVSAARLHA